MWIILVGMLRVLLFLLVFSAEAQNWPPFRGPGASGAADGQNLPLTWDVKTGASILWRTPVAGLAHSSPSVWGGRIFVTTAVSRCPGATFKRGLYGEGDASDDTSTQQWKVLCFDLKTGKPLWERTAYEGRPTEKRHVKSTYASSTPATDGRVLVAYFGSQGLYAYDLDGKPLWNRDLGRLDVGAYDAPEYEWGTARSPILYDGRVTVQCDQQKGSFITALNSKSGETLWRTGRDESPSCGNAGIFDCYDKAGGGEICRQRIPHQGSGFSASPVASDGYIYLPSFGAREE
jgi:outer membrane protein assembly factor BamB